MPLSGLAQFLLGQQGFSEGQRIGTPGINPNAPDPRPVMGPPLSRAGSNQSPLSMLSPLNNPFLLNILAQQGRMTIAPGTTASIPSPLGIIGKAALMTQQQQRQQQQFDLQERLMKSQIGLYDAKAAAMGSPEVQEQFELLGDQEIADLGLDPNRDYQRSTTTGKLSAVGGAGQTINVSNEGQIPPNHRAVRDEQGRIIRYEVIPGSPTEKETEAGSRLRSIQAQTVVEDIYRLNKQITAGSVPFGRSAAAQAQLNPVLQTDGYRNATALIESVKGNVGVDSLINIKKSGAGLGQVPQSQLDLLSRLLGELSLNQDKEQFERTWNRIGEVYREIWRVADDDLKAIGAMPPEVFDMQIGGETAQDRINRL